MLEMHREEETPGRIAAKHKIHHTVPHKVNRTVTEGLSDLFADPRKKSAEDLEKDSTINDLYKQVGLLPLSRFRYDIITVS
ncbi:hypothetical protein [Aminivibrio sp.]|uniref:hypothetical protein n=1 Tax=Aminivibrio sp. TaxID=1872489 RepID=UPI001A630C1A|nr:hypothetical protein [Aminivibrio sp.]MBL3540483.1 hypothetical protein [Aminivibrio sp.]